MRACRNEQLTALASGSAVVNVVPITEAGRRRAAVAAFDVIFKNDSAAVTSFTRAVEAGDFKVVANGKELQVAPAHQY